MRNIPAVDRPVGLRIALLRVLAERTLPRRRVGEVEVEQDAIGIECDNGTGHDQTLAREPAPADDTGALLVQPFTSVLRNAGTIAG